MGHDKQKERGLLPFRVWQFYDAMEEFARAGEPDKFLCAAGLLSHYVGDACQPLHGSIYADGYPDDVGKGIHSTYETKMVDRYAEEIVTGIKNKLGQAGIALPQITSGKKAASAIIELMYRSSKTIPPRDLVDAFVEAGGTTHVAVQDALWEQFGDKTIKVMTDGARVLARIWQGAWARGNGNSIPASQLGTIDPDLLNEHSRNVQFVESLDLDHIRPVLKP